MRFINVLILAAVIFGAVWFYIYVAEFAKYIGLLDFTGSYGSRSELLLKTIVPHALIVCLVLGAGGAVLCRFVDSPVPLMWCLALGFLCATANLLAFSSRSIEWVLFNTLISLAMLAAPILGGYPIKRRARRGPKRPSD
jgi:hypothetical protein